jgi:hypothetical protein
MDTLNAKHQARIDIAANQATPAIATIIGEILKSHGAEIRYSDLRAAPTRPMKTGKRSLKGLTIHIDRLTWVRDEETERWSA